MKTFRIRNRHGVEVNVTEDMAVSLRGNPSVKILGEVEYKEELKELEVPNPIKKGTIHKVKRMVSKIIGIKDSSVPGSENTDVEYTGNTVRRKSVVTKSNQEIKKSKLTD